MGAYSDFVTDMDYIRDKGDFAGAVLGILNTRNERISVTDEEAKAFLIHLVIASLGVGIESDIVLCSFGLLVGYENLDGVTKRRLKLKDESGYLWRETGRATERPPKARAKDLIPKERNLYQRMERYYWQIPDKSAFLEAAKMHYLELKPRRDGVRRAILPRPAYLCGTPMPTNNLPLANQLFIGREDVLEMLAEKFKAGENILLLYGVGGVGKTQIAKRYAYTHTSDYGTIGWIDATSAETMQESCRDFLKKVDPDLNPMTEDTVHATFLSYFEKGTDWLLIFDNADYLDRNTNEEVDSRAVLESYLPKSAGDILITTRCNSDFAGADRIPVDVFSRELSIEFLAQETRQEADENTTLLAEKLGGLPLALQYAASYIKRHTTCKGYLDLWDKSGMQLFDDKDGHYADRTVRQAFHITLVKIKDNSLAMDLLHRLACLNVVRLPLRAYLEAILEEQDAPFRDSRLTSVWTMTRTLYDDVKRRYLKEVQTERIINGEITTEKREYIYSEDATQSESFVLLQDPLHDALKEELSRNKLLLSLAEYSLIDWDKASISMHPLLRDIVFDELTPKEKIMWYNSHKTPMMLLRMYQLSDNEEAVAQSKYAIICRKLELIEEEKKDIVVFTEDIRGKIPLEENHPSGTLSTLLLHNKLYRPSFSSADVLMDANKIFWDILELNDVELAKHAMELWRQCMKAFSGVADYLYNVLLVRRQERVFWDMIAGGLNRDLIYRGYNTPKECKDAGAKYYTGFAHRIFDGKAYPATDALHAVVDIWLEDDGNFKEKVQNLISDEDSDWWVIALP